MRCSIVKNGTINAGMSTKGNRVIGLVVTFPISPLIPGKAPEDRAPIDTATTKSVIPRIFHITNRRLAANNGLRIRLSAIHGALYPDCHVPEPSRKSEQSWQNTICVERDHTKAAPPPGLHRSHESEVGVENEVPERTRSEICRKKQR